MRLLTESQRCVSRKRLNHFLRKRTHTQRTFICRDWLSESAPVVHHDVRFRCLCCISAEAVPPIPAIQPSTISIVGESTGKSNHASLFEFHAAVLVRCDRSEQSEPCHPPDQESLVLYSIWYFLKARSFPGASFNVNPTSLMPEQIRAGQPADRARRHEQYAPQLGRLP